MLPLLIRLIQNSKCLSSMDLCKRGGSRGRQPPSADGGAPGVVAVSAGQRHRRAADGLSGVSPKIRPADAPFSDGVPAVVDAAGAAAE